MGEDDIRDNAYLAYEFLVSRSITTSTKSLVQEGQEDRDNNTRFNRFSKTDKEYYQLSPKSARILQSRWDFDVPGTAKTLTIITTLVLLNADSVLNRNSVFRTVVAVLYSSSNGGWVVPRANFYQIRLIRAELNLSDLPILAPEQRNSSTSVDYLLYVLR